jgi:hypothetical protein
MFEEHGLALTVRADDYIMESQRKLDDGMKAGVTAMPWEHLLDKYARVTGAKHVNQSIPGDGLSAEFGGALNGIHLGGLYAFQDSLRLADVFESRVHVSSDGWARVDISPKFDYSQQVCVVPYS